MFNDLGFIMKHSFNDDVDDAIHGFFYQICRQKEVLRILPQELVCRGQVS